MHLPASDIQFPSTRLASLIPGHVS